MSYEKLLVKMKARYEQSGPPAQYNPLCPEAYVELVSDLLPSTEHIELALHWYGATSKPLRICALRIRKTLMQTRDLLKEVDLLLFHPEVVRSILRPVPSQAKTSKLNVSWDPISTPSKGYKRFETALRKTVLNNCATDPAYKQWYDGSVAKHAWCLVPESQLKSVIVECVGNGSHTEILLRYYGIGFEPMTYKALAVLFDLKPTDMSFMASSVLNLLSSPERLIMLMGDV